MAELFAGLLVSCPNDGGLFYIDGHRPIKVDGLDTTGLAQSGKYMLRGLQPDRVHVMDAAGASGGETVLVPDIHDVLVDGVLRYAVGTLANEVLEIGCDGAELRRFTFPGEPDSWHINCLVRFGGRVLFSAFGDFREHRGYKLKPVGSGFVQDLHTGERLVEGLSQPHSLVTLGERLLVANSYEGELHEYDEAFRLVRKRDVGGYARGVLVNGDVIYVGLSCSRNRDGGVGQATLLALDAVSWDEIARLALPANEIYDVLKPRARDLPAILAMNASLATKVLVDRSAETERSLGGEMARLQEQANGYQAQIEALAEKLQAAGAHEDELRRESGQARDELRQQAARWRDEVRAKDARVEELLRQMDRERDLSREREAQIWSELQVKNSSIDALRLDLERQRSEYGRRETHMLGELRLRDSSIDALRLDLERQRSEFGRRETQLLGELRLRDSSIDALRLGSERKDEEFRQRNARLSDELQAKDDLASGLSLQLERKHAEMQRQSELSSEMERQLFDLKSALAGQEAYLDLVHGSLSWRMTAPMRAGKAFLRRMAGNVRGGFSALAHVFRDASTRRKYVRIARQLGLVDAMRHAGAFLRRGGPSPEPGTLPVRSVFDLRKAGAAPVVVLSTKHCRYVAELIVSALARAGIAARAIYETPEGPYDDVPHFVICPQMFERLPGLYVSFQMEQSVSTRWFTPDYLRKLENSFAIFDYSLENIAKLVSMGLHARQFYYMPVGYLPGYAMDAAAVDKEYDVLFYGDINNDRRRACIAELEKVCKVKVVSNLFGPEMADELRRARVVVNIHYYEGALLESTRLWECLSLDCVVVSERSSDMEQHGELPELVDFVDEGDFAGMAARVRYWLEDEARRNKRVAENAASMASAFNRFDYFFFRFLLASGNISFEGFWTLVGSEYPLSSDRLCLNLPEFTDRAASFDRDNRHGFHRFPGLRHSKGWIGCALSYKYMTRLAMKQGLPAIAICEDDVEFPPDFGAVWPRIRSYLEGNAGKWHIFSGLMTDLHEDAKILGVERRDGRDFVTTNKLISMVFNVYDQACYADVAAWDDSNEDVTTNTIDRYLEAKDSIKVLTTCPFLVGHKEDLHSTLWGGQNTIYTALIAKSEALLRKKVSEWHGKRNGNCGRTMRLRSRRT